MSSFYEIRVKGQLGPEWSEWFGGLEVIATQSGETVLKGLVTDQPELFGLLTKIRNLGLPLLALQRLSMAQISPFAPDDYHNFC